MPRQVDGTRRQIDNPDHARYLEPICGASQSRLVECCFDSCYFSQAGWYRDVRWRGGADKASNICAKSPFPKNPLPVGCGPVRPG